MVSQLNFVIAICFVFCGFVTAEIDDLKEYLYLKENPEDVYPIQEFKAEPQQDGEPEKPKFLYDEAYPYPRVVEFYAHWCPHCQHFKPSYIKYGKKLMSMTSQMGAIVETFAVSCVPNKNICSDMKIKGYPTVKFFPAHSINGTKMDPYDLHPMQTVKWFGLSTDNYNEEQWQQEIQIDNLPPPPPQKGDRSISKTPHFLARSKKATFDDAHLSFDFAMRNSIYTSLGPLPEKPKGILEEFLKVLQATFPTNASLQPVLEDLLTNFKSISSGEEQLNAVMEKYPPPSSRWSRACEQHGTGYTCGLWQLFHIMSVGLVEWNHLTIVEEQILSTLHVAEALRNYIEYFFQCDECRSNFLLEYDACGHDRCNRLTEDQKGTVLKDWIEFPLWLYETHNGVNVRLRQERIDAGDEAPGLTTQFEVMWPAMETCPSCWLSEDRWDEDEVYRYLRLEYWPDDYKSELIRSQMKQVPAHFESLQRSVNDHRKISKNPSEDFESEQISYQEVAKSLLAVTLVFGGIFWYRKRQFDRKGYHKKRESDFGV